jgi:hypothetical protein
MIDIIFIIVVAFIILISVAFGYYLGVTRDRVGEE